MSGQPSRPKRPGIQSRLESLPDKPGIYTFRNRRGEIIYVGKAQSLKERVKSYFQPSPDPKVGSIIAEATDVDYILTESEREAAFLEQNFIQRYQPKYNLRLKDDKSFPYLKITMAERFPGVYLTRRIKPDGSMYFGPFSPASGARKAIDLLKKSFGLRTCEEAIPGRRERACLTHELGLCSAPCVGRIDEAAYSDRVEDAILFLEGKTDRLRTIIETKMEQAAAAMDFEQAAKWRDLIQTIDSVKDKPKVISVGLEDVDIFGFARLRDRAAVCAFLMRRGKVREAEKSDFRAAETTAKEAILGNFLLDYYSLASDIPGKILLPFASSSNSELETLLGRKKGAKVKILIPRKGRDRKLVELATRNAETLLKRSSEEIQALFELAAVAGLPSPPLRIEGFDISNTGGDESVGSLVVFEMGRPKREEYRKYKIRGFVGPNDVRSLAEIVGRRYGRLLKEGARLPDLVLVDGGKGQLQAARRALTAMKLDRPPVVSLAKKQETVFVQGKKEGLRLERTSPALKLLQHIRDEAHRFAVSYHRHRRQKKSFGSWLEEIPGLGPKRKEALLLRYRTPDEIRAAALEELSAIVGKAVALRLKQSL